MPKSNTELVEEIQIWRPAEWRRRKNPWTGEIQDYGRNIVPDSPIDFVGKNYANTVYGTDAQSVAHHQRNSLIESIISVDESRKEYIKRLILEEDRIDVLMRVLGYRTPSHQIMLNDFLIKNKYGIVLAPRGSGKSTSCNVCFAIMRALQRRDVRILIASRTVEQAKSFLYEIKINLLKPELVDIFGKLQGDKWDETQADIEGRVVSAKEHTFTIAGADGAVVSKHFDVLIIDDIVEEKNSRTEGKRRGLRKFYYRSLLPTLRPDGELRMLGTRYHPEDLYGYIIENDPMFKQHWFVLPAVFDKDTGESVDIEQDNNGKFFAPKNAISYDPVGFPLKKIIQRRSSMPLADFECQYQNRVMFMDGDYFKTDWFQYYDEEPDEIVSSKGLAVWMGVDLAISQKDEADEFAIVVVGIVPRVFDIYVLDYFSARLTFNKQKATLIHFYDKWNPTKSFVEANAYQHALQSTTVEEFPDVRAIPIWTTKDKVTRARSMQVYYERRQVWHRKGRSAKLETQLTGFPDVKLKDLFDAQYIAISGALQGGARKRRRAEEEFGLF